MFNQVNELLFKVVVPSAATSAVLKAALTDKIEGAALESITLQRPGRAAGTWFSFSAPINDTTIMNNAGHIQRNT